MPYIQKFRRNEIDAGAQPQDVGELTYQLFKSCVDYMKTFEKPRYEDFAECVAALENAKLEFYRTKLSAYEDKKKFENGGVE